MILLLQLFLAHIIGDFFLQPDKWVRDKETKKLRSVYLYLHILVHFVLILVIVGNTGFWKPALLIAVLHLLIDGIKLVAQRPRNARTWFFADQVLHLAVILAVGSYEQQLIPDFHLLYDKKILVPLTGVLFVLNPASFIIKAVTSKWTAILPGEPLTDASLANAGKLIGMMERVLVLIFVFLGKWEGVGFLLAAKSVFRFGDLKEARNMQLTEYVLIGTLLSFGIAIITGLMLIELLAK